MKQVWEKPRIEVQKFIPNEYVAACYKINCTTPNGNSKYYYLYDDTNGNGVWDNSDELLYGNWFGFTGCNSWHKGVIRDEAPTANGFVTDGTNTASNRSDAVFWWYEKFYNGSVNYHVMTPGNENYETNPNAS
ncbi:MAG: hypothetical protein ACI3VA_01480 [Candidatus Limivicinus sp.]